MTQINWQYQVNNRAGGYIVTNTDWNDVAGDLRALIDQTTSSTTDNTPLPIGIDLANDRVYISDPDSTTPEDANHADTTLSVVGTTTLAGNTQQTGTFTVGVDDTGHDVKFFGATATNGYMLWDESEDELIFGTSVKVGVGAPSPNNSVSVGIATASPVPNVLKGLDLQYGTETKGGVQLNPSTGEVRMGSLNSTGSYFTTLYANNAEAMRVDASGNVIVGGTTAFSDPEAVALTVVGNIGATVAGASTVCDFLLRNDTSDTTWLMSHRASGGSNGLQWWYHNGTSWVGPQLGITTAGEVGVGTATPTSFGGVNLEIYDTGIAGVLVNTGTYTGQFHASASGIIMGARSNHDVFIGTNNTTRITITAAGAVSVAGAFSKGSGSFDIAHPTKGGDWRLRHSFIEGPQADLIYRGTVTLSGGTAAIDLDTASHMTDGTWEALCRDPWAMVASSGNAVEWSLSGKTLTITSDTADAVCNWMVIAERQDDHMKGDDCPLCDDDGHFVTEYEREDDGHVPVEEIIPDEADDEAEEAA